MFRVPSSFSIPDGEFDYDLTGLDTDEHEPVARNFFSSSFENTRRYGHKIMAQSKCIKAESPNVRYLEQFDSDMRS